MYKITAINPIKLNKLYNHTDYKGLTNVNRNEFYEKIADYFNG